MTPSVKIADGVLRCPCGWLHTHQGEVGVYRRFCEDAQGGTAVRFPTPGMGVMVSMSENPSLRRDGIRISILCEECEKTSILTICQHKGETLIEWEAVGL